MAMDELEAAAAGIRFVESNGNYAHQVMARIGDERKSKVGAYGFIEDRWTQLSDAMGYSGGDWRDPTLQDKIAKEKLNRDYQQLGDWGLAALAFRYGTRAASQLQSAGLTEPGAIEKAGYPDMAQYLRSFKRGEPAKDLAVTGTVNSAVPQQIKPTATRQRAEGVVRNHLTSMRNMQRKRRDTPAIAGTDIEGEVTTDELGMGSQ